MLRLPEGKNLNKDYSSEYSRYTTYGGVGVKARQVLTLRRFIRSTTREISGCKEKASREKERREREKVLD